MLVSEMTSLRNPSHHSKALPMDKEIYMRLLLEGHLEFIGLMLDERLFFSDPAARIYVVVLLELNKADARERELLDKQIRFDCMGHDCTMEWSGWLNKHRKAAILSSREGFPRVDVLASTVLTQVAASRFQDLHVRLACAVGDPAETVKQIPASYQAARKRMEDKLSFETASMIGQVQALASREEERERRRTIRSYILEHYRNPSFSLMEISEYFQMKPPHFSTFFKELFGEKFIDFLTRLRVDFAKHLLQSTEESVQTVGQQVGYVHSVSFIRAFKKSVGRTPGDYRRESAVS